MYVLWVNLYRINLSVFITEAEKCLLLGTNWVLKSHSYSFVLIKLTYASVSKEHPTYNNTKEGCFRHILRRNYLLIHVIEGKIRKRNGEEADVQ